MSKVVVYYSSRTGSVTNYLKQCFESSKIQESDITFCNLSNFQQYQKPDFFVFAISTKQGKAPDEAEIFLTKTVKEQSVQNYLKTAPIFLFGVGDSRYKTYQIAAKQLQELLPQTEEFMQFDVGGDIQSQILKTGRLLAEMLM